MPHHEKYRTILLFGPPGAGKGTQGTVLGCLPGFLHVSSGDCFRALDPDCNVAAEVNSYIERGELVPDDLTVKVWKNAVEGFIDDGRFNPETDLLVLDGIPRSVGQAEAMDRHIEVLCLVSLVSNDEDAIVERIKGRALQSGRPDDAVESVIRHRQDVHRQETEPVLDFYPDELKREVDAMQSPAEVLRSVLDCILPVLSLLLAGAVS